MFAFQPVLRLGDKKAPMVVVDHTKTGADKSIFDDKKVLIGLSAGAGALAASAAIATGYGIHHHYQKQKKKGDSGFVTSGSTSPSPSSVGDEGKSVAGEPAAA